MRAVEKQRFRALLEQKRSELLESFRRSQEANMQPGEEGLLDLADRATESYTREFLYRLSDGDREQIRRIDNALHRLEEGTYGECEECAEKIPPARLKAIPWALLCVGCQEESEARAGIAPPR